MIVHTGSGRKRMVTFGAAAAVLAGMLAGPATLASATGRHPSGYAKVSRAPRLPDGAQRVGNTRSGATVSGAVAIKPRNPAALEAAAAAVSNPRSTSYHHYLAKGEFAARYGPTAATIGAVRSALMSSHLSVTSVSADHLLVHFRGTVGAANSAFHTRIANYRLPNGRTGRESATSVSFPASVAGQVSAVVGLDTLTTASSSFEHATHPASVKAHAPAHFAHPHGAPNACSAARADAISSGGLTDDQIANAYGTTPLYAAHDLGAGQSVAVYELEPFSTTDLEAFDKCFYGTSAATTMLSHVHTVTVDGGAGSGEGSGESILDVEDVSGIAPDATIDVYEAPGSATGTIDEYAKMVNDDTDNEITSSYGFCEIDEQQLEPGYINVENDIFQQAALQGQSVFNSSGDDGSDTCAYHGSSPNSPDLSTSDPASQPFVTAVGGTTISDADTPPTERTWNDGSVGGAAGGGVSSVWGAPSWQTAVDGTDTGQVTQAVSDGLQACPQYGDGGLCREVPDVSAQADELTGSITIYAAEFDGWTTIGGTSSSTPLWAAMTALINSSAACASSTQPKGGVGFISPALYAVAASPPQYDESFNDITTGNTDVFGQFGGSDYAAGPGYDMATGLGSPILAHSNGDPGLAENLCLLQRSATRPAVTSTTPTKINASSPPASLVIHGTGLAGVSGVSVGGFNVPAADITTDTATAVTITSAPTAAQAGTGGDGPQDGTGRRLVGVTDANGVSSLPSAASSVLYVDTLSGQDITAVAGAAPYGGPQTGTHTIQLIGSDLDTLTGVTVGGVTASFTATSDPNQLRVTVPAYIPGTTSCLGTDHPVNDVCQAQIVATNGHGSSATATILPPYTGAPFEGTTGGMSPPDCVTHSTCEDVPATTEYDYFAAPSITSVTPNFLSEDPSHQTIATITGAGFDLLGLDWVNFGKASDPDNEDFDIVSATPTKIDIAANPLDRPSVNPVVKPVTVQTVAGLSGAKNATYAGIPRVTSVSPHAGVDTGGTPFTITGTGFAGVAPGDGGSIQYMYDFGLTSSQLSDYTATSSTKITGTTVANNPGQFSVLVCTITDCSFPPFSEKAFNATLFDFFDTGDPVVTGLSVKSGPASGGTHVVITGTDLSDATAVHFGSAAAPAANAETFLTNGSNSEIYAIAPPGTAGKTVNVTVTTVESEHGGHSSATSNVDRYTYRLSVPAAPRDVTPTVHHTQATVHWKMPASTGGAKILRYRVTAKALKTSNKKGAKAPKPTVVLTKNGNARHAALKGLSAGWLYEFRVQAVNRLGKGLPGTNERVYLIRVAA